MSSRTVMFYLARVYFAHFIFLLCAFMALIYLFDTVELLRRASKYTDVSLLMVLQMGGFKLPEALQVVLPFAVLFSAMFTFWQLNKRYELIVMRAGGFSVWQFLKPLLFVGLLIGLVYTTVLNPVGAVFLGKYESLEREYLTRQKSQIALFEEGLWLRQVSDIDRNGHVILHAKRIGQPDWTLHDVTALYFDGQDNLMTRADAKTANLQRDQWLFKDVYIHAQESNFSGATRTYLTLKTDLTIKDVEESFSSAETLSFWRLPDHIKTLKNTGFDASRLQVHFHGLLAQPLMFAAMILLAATVSIRPPRAQKTFMLILLGIGVGFIVFFLSSYLQALGASRQLPPVLAAWSPAIILSLLGVSVMMSLEDG
jgi:lipopolysaccharide export system permease protein